MVERYRSVAEVIAFAKKLTASHPRLCSLRVIGTSRAGRPLHLLSVGRGPRDVLIVAGPHANEAAVGSATTLRLARQVTHDEALHTDATWHFLLCIDPDGARLNDGWLSGPHTVTSHYREIFRPHADEQPEWLSGEPGALAEPLPETRALLGVIDELRPFLQCSLHATDLGGTYAQLTRDIPGLSGRLGKLASELDIPVDVGSADAFYWLSPGPGVYVLPPDDEEESWEAVPSDATRSTWAYAGRYGGVTAILEVPMWSCDGSADPSRHPDPDRALRHEGDKLRRDIAAVADALAEVRALRPRDDDPLLRVVEHLVDLAPRLPVDWDPAVRRPDAPPLPPMTVARITGVEVYARRVPLRAAAMLRRFHPTARLERLVAEWGGSYERRFGARWVPIARQAEQQAGIVLAAYELLRGAA